MSIRKPGSPTFWPASPSTPFTSSTSSCPGTRRRFGLCRSGSLIVAAISAVFTISHVAKLLCEDEDWLYDLSIYMFPEDGCLRVYSIREDGVTAFTDYFI